MPIEIRPKSSLGSHLVQAGMSAVGAYGQGYAGQSAALMNARPSGIAAGNASMAPLQSVMGVFTDTYKQAYGTYANLASQENAQQARAELQNTAHKYAMESQGVEGKMRLNDWSMREYGAPLVEGDPRFQNVPSLEKQFAEGVASGQGPTEWPTFFQQVDTQKTQRQYKDYLDKNGLTLGLLPADEQHNASIRSAIAKLDSNPQFINSATGQFLPEYWSAKQRLGKELRAPYEIPKAGRMSPQESLMATTAVEPSTGVRVTRDNRSGVWKPIVPPQRNPAAGRGGAGGAGGGAANQTGTVVDDFVNMTLTGRAAGMSVSDIAQDNQISAFRSDPDLDVITAPDGKVAISNTRKMAQVAEQKVRMEARKEAFNQLRRKDEVTGEEIAPTPEAVEKHARMLLGESESVAPQSAAAPVATVPQIPGLMPLPKDPTKPDAYEVGKTYSLTRNGQQVYGQYQGNGVFLPVNP